ncbi:Luciferase family protein [Nitrosopumilaceae archaeon]|nr:Luciferase family protein [Nitrosopumilaceae archaeon]
MRTSFSLGSLLPVGDLLDCASRVPAYVDTLWIPETWGMEAFSVMAAASARAEHCRIGSSIVNIYSRSPALAAMGAATVDLISGGRAVLGLGASSREIVGSLHGMGRDEPLSRMREFVEVVRLAHGGGRIDHRGRIFDLSGFRLLVDPGRRIPVYLAAVGPAMCRLAWEVGDGVILYLRPPGEISRLTERLGRGRIDVACQIITCVAEDADAAIDRARRTLGFYIGAGSAYREFLAANGFAEEVAAVMEGLRGSGLGRCHEAVPDRMVDRLCIAGAPGECAGKLGAFRDAGVDLPVLQFNPAGDVRESFGLFAAEFDEGGA